MGPLVGNAYRNRRRVLLLCCFAFLTSLTIYLLVHITQEQAGQVVYSFSLDQSQRDLLLNLTNVTRTVQTVGKSFKFPRTYLESLGFPITRFETITAESARRFVFVTASSENHFEEAMDAIGVIQNLFPNYWIIYYDLGFKKSHIHRAKINQLCGVLYRKFDFNKYPSHVRHLLIYSWKPIIIQEVLLEYPGVFWLDTSVRFLTDNITELVQLVVSNGGVMTFDNTGHSIFTTTHSGMYRYLPITAEVASRLIMRGAGANFYFRTEQVYNGIIRWWFLCALTRDCISSTTSINCDSPRINNIYSNCNRFDQSALNILLAHSFLYDDERYYFNVRDNGALPTKKLLKISRESRHKEKLRLCSTEDGRTFGMDGNDTEAFPLVTSRELFGKNTDFNLQAYLAL